MKNSSANSSIPLALFDLSTAKIAIPMVPNTLANSNRAGKVKEFTVFPTMTSTWASGKTISSMETESTSTQVVNDTKVNSSKVESKAEESTIIVQVQFTKANGKRTERMDLESTPIPMEKNMRETG